MSSGVLGEVVRGWEGTGTVKGPLGLKLKGLMERGGMQRPVRSGPFELEASSAVDTEGSWSFSSLTSELCRPLAAITASINAGSKVHTRVKLKE
jgi:hypothetical protein